MEKVEKPWGWYLDFVRMNTFVFKQIVVKPLQRISLQLHQNRKEYWFIHSGVGVLVNGPREFSTEGLTGSVFINRLTPHRIENISSTEDLIVFEVQIGDKLDENDIVRIDDDYNRTILRG